MDNIENFLDNRVFNISVLFIGLFLGSVFIGPWIHNNLHPMGTSELLKRGIIEYNSSKGHLQYTEDFTKVDKK